MERLDKLVSSVFGLSRRVYGGSGLLEHRVLGLEALQTVVDLLCHAVVIGVGQLSQIARRPLGDVGDACY